jgi:hypothetical protein
MSNKCIIPTTVKSIKERLLNGELDANEIAKLLPEEKAQVKAILEGVVSEKLGIKVSSKEVREINNLAKKIDESRVKLGDNLGSPEHLDDNVNFFKAKKQMDDYLNKQSPSSKLRVATGTVGRGMMLFSFKSPILNIGSNIELAITEKISRAITTGVKGADNNLAKDYIKMARKIYRETGYDVSRMMNLSDKDINGGRVLGETVSSEGEGAVRAAGRVVEDIVFKNLMGAPDVAFASYHFADSINSGAVKMAKSTGKNAKEIMADAMKLEPLTDEGKILRAQGILDAQVATWTNNTWASQVSEGIRKILNNLSGDLRVGDYLLPFVKTPANVIATGMDYGGLGIPKALIKTYKAIKAGDIKDPDFIRSASRDLIRAGMGLTGAVIFADAIGVDNFVGAYDPARAQIEELRNSNYNAIRIGGKWVSVDWLGPLSVPISAMLYAKKYGGTAPEQAFQYGKGVLESAVKIPGVADIYDQVKTSAYKKDQSLEEMTGDAKDYVIGEVYSRLVPSFISDISKVLDPFKRDTSGSTNGIPNNIIARTPFSIILPEKTNIFGDKVKNEDALFVMLFGARVKTDKENSTIKEIIKVSNDTDKSINFTDWSKSSSKTLTQFKEQIGTDEFKKAKIIYGNLLKKELDTLFNKNEYKNLSDDEKLKVISGKDSDVMNELFKKYNFKYKKTTIPKAPYGL